MNIILSSMHSIQDAIRTMYMSKRSWTPEKEAWLRDLCDASTDRHGKPLPDCPEEFKVECAKLFKWGQKHITMLRFLDLSVIVEGLHRGATDDFDAHAKRLENRIIRSSTRLADYTLGEMSDWYKGKIIPYDMAFDMLGIDNLPASIRADNDIEYVRTTNGYIRADLANNRDVKRGLYMLSIPMTFTFKVNVVELAHIYRERGMKSGGAHGTAAPELQEMMEKLMDQVGKWYPWITREWLLTICN